MKEKGREEKLKAPPAPLVLPPKDVALPLFSPTAAMRITAVLPSLTPVLPEKLFEEKEKPKGPGCWGLREQLAVPGRPKTGLSARTREAV